MFIVNTHSQRWRVSQKRKFYADFESVDKVAENSREKFSTKYLLKNEVLDFNYGVQKFSHFLPTFKPNAHETANTTQNFILDMRLIISFCIF
jgi:uncharacterized protein YjbK